MAQPIDYHYVAVVQKYGKFALADGQHWRSLTYISTSWSFCLGTDEVAIFKLTLTDKEGGRDYAYSHDKFEPFTISKALAERLIKTRRLGFFDSARVTAKPTVSAYEVRTYVFDPDDYVMRLANKVETNKVLVELVHTQQDVMKAISVLIKDRHFTYDELRELIYTCPRAAESFYHLLKTIEQA